MAGYADTVYQDSAETRPYAGVQVTVRNAAAPYALASITDNNGGAIAGSTVTTDGLGAFSFYANSGSYLLQYVVSGTIRRERNIVIGQEDAGEVDFVQSGTSAAIRTTEAKLRESVSIADFGDGASVTALKLARDELFNRGGGELLIPRGSYSFASSDLATAIDLPSNIDIQGRGSIISVTGSSIISTIFSSADSSNVSINDLLVIGNGLAVNDSASGGFALFTLSAGAATDSENLQINRVRLTNFKANRWLAFRNDNASGKRILGIRGHDVRIFSQAGNSLDPASIGTESTAFHVFGNAGLVQDVEITGLYAEADFIKAGITIFHKVKDVLIDKPVITNAGQIGANDDKGGYALNVYMNPGEGENIVISDPIIRAPRSCGIYLRGVDKAVVRNPVISGQTDTTNGTIPKGAIAGDGSTNIQILGGNLSGNAITCDFVGAASGGVFGLKMIGVKGLGTAGIILNPGPTTGHIDGVDLIDCDIEVTGASARALQVLNGIAGSTGRINNVTIAGGSYTSNLSIAIELLAGGSTGAAADDYTIDGVKVSYAGYGVVAEDGSGNGITGKVTIRNLSTIELSGATGSSYGLLAQNCTKLNLDDFDPTFSVGGSALLTGSTIKGPGFFGTAHVGKPTITGSRSGNAALADLITKLASTGLVNDGTTA